MHVTRREFLRSVAAAAGASALPKWYLAESEGAVASPVAVPGPNDRPAVALIGCGGMGRGDARNATRFGRVVALCDVDASQLAEARKLFPGAEPYRDFRAVLARDDIDVVICATVDHWHAPIASAAMRAGKDVYCEKPLTLTIDEGRRLVTTARKTGRVLQTGSQQRSDRRFRLACELVRNGRIGKVTEVETWLPAGRREGPFRASPVPPGLDWDFWLGPAPFTPYVKERCHVTFRYWWEYSGGTMTDWGAHHNDIALWGLGMEHSGPETIEARSLTEMIPHGFSAVADYHVIFTYANGVVHHCRSTPDDTWSGGIANKNGQRNGVKFIGTDGWIWVTRSEIEASHPDLLATPLSSDATRLYASNDHMGNFFDCVRSRRAPICEPEIGHRSAAVCHLGVIALRVGRKLAWDPKKERFVGDRAANAWLAREARKPFA
jgi:predicted dehydrogenase